MTIAPKRTGFISILKGTKQMFKNKFFQLWLHGKTLEEKVLNYNDNLEFLPRHLHTKSPNFLPFSMSFIRFISILWHYFWAAWAVHKVRHHFLGRDGEGSKIEEKVLSVRCCIGGRSLMTSYIGVGRGVGVQDSPKKGTLQVGQGR